MIRDKQFDFMLCAERKDQWLAEKEARERAAAMENLIQNGRRFGLLEQSEGGWSMQAPDFRLSGMVRDRGEWEEEEIGSN